MRTHFPWKELGYAAGFVCLLLALYVGVHYATVLTSPVGEGIPVSELPPEAFGPSRDDLKAIPLSAFRRTPVQERVVGPGDTPDKVRVQVIREDVKIGVAAGSRHGSGQTLDLPVYENDVFNALDRTGGMPGLNARDEVVVERSMPGGGTKIIRIPTRLRIGETIPFSQSDIILENGDIVFVEVRDIEVYYTGGVLQSKQIALPRDYDLRAVQAVALANGPVVNSDINNLPGTILAEGLGNSSPSQLTVIRKTKSLGLITVRVDLNQALLDPRENIVIQPGDYLVLRETVGSNFTFTSAYQFLHSLFSSGVVDAEGP